MAVELWIGQEFDTSHERQALDHFLAQMNTRFGQSTDLYLVLANYFLDGRQIDLTVLKRNAIIIIELKEYAEPFLATENGVWQNISTGAVVGTGSQNPFEQGKDYRIKWINLLRNKQNKFLRPSKAQSMDFNHVSAFVAISPSLHPAHQNHLPRIPWFRLVGLDELSTVVHQQASRKLNFSDEELRSLAKNILNLRATHLTTTQIVPTYMESSHIGRYKILDLLSRGGMGAVYQAYDPDLDRQVVVKLIASATPIIDNQWRERFRREVQAASQLSHPHIVTVYDVGLDHEPPFVVMELLSGGTLEERLKRKPLTWQEALAMTRLLAQTLAYAHNAGVIHRDVKPANIMFAGVEPDTLKLVDFGLAYQKSREALTQAGDIIGTVIYMSPEQARGEIVDQRTDIFALGIILFEAIAGRNPLDKGSTISTLQGAMSDTQIDMSPLIGKAPPDVIHLIERAVAKERNQRYSTCELLLADLDDCLNNSMEASTLQITSQSIVKMTDSSPTIQVAANINLTAEIETVLRTMFNAFSQIAIEAEFGHGFSGSRIFRVRLIERGGKVHLPAAIKIAPIGLIREEWQAYKTLVEHTLPNIARLEAPPIFPLDSSWGGLRYALVGGGTFIVQSLYDYYQQAALDDLRWVLEDRLFKFIGSNWWLDNQANRAFQMQTDYDTLLPVNLLLKFIPLPLTSDFQRIEAKHNLSLPAITTGTQVLFKGFVITRVDVEQQQLTLNLPPASEGQPQASCRIRLENVPNIEHYRVSQIIDAIGGEIVATRHNLLTHLASRALGPTFDLSAEWLILSDKLSLPNPLLAYQGLLRDFLTVKISTVHGDMNLENILVDPATREVSLIDFATVRRGHTLHDLLRLETEVLIKLIPLALIEGGSPIAIIYPFYEQLHEATLHPGQTTLSNLPDPTLEKPFKMLLLIRNMARKCLFNSDNWREYYQGLTLYLLGALKFEDLYTLPTAPLPGQAAFWGAAIAQHLLETPWPKQSVETGSLASITLEREPLVEIEPPYGTMRSDSKLYIERAADSHCWAQLTKSYAVTLFIQAPRQMGKSSLMRRALEQVKHTQRQRSVFIDFQKFPEQYFFEEENFLVQLCLLIGDALDIPEAIDQYWHGRHTGIIKCSRYLSRYIIPQLNTPMILAMDEVERILNSSFRANFFGMLRTWHNDRVHDENFAKLTLFLSSSTEPYLFIDNPNQSPFNVAEVISLQDFTRPEVDELNQRHGLPLNQSQIDELMDLIEGHPFLTRLALYLLTTKRITSEALCQQAVEDNGPFSDHLSHYLLRVLQKPELKQALAQICRDHSYEENQVFYRLKGAGLIKKVGQQVVLRNRLYTRYFEERLRA